MINAEGILAKRVRLGDVAEVKWGDTQTTKAAYRDEGFLAFSATGPDGFMDHFDHEGPGIVLSAIGAQCGKTWYADGKWSCIKNTIYLKGMDGTANTRFLYYATALPDFWPKRGAAQPFISQGDARKCELILPPLPTQRRIASILGAYDNLIEVNRRRIAVLEKIAHELFEEWFVRFRFPGHQGVPIIDTLDGPLPAGWHWAPLSTLAKFKSGNNKLTKAAYRETGVVAYSASGPDGFVDHAEGHGPAVIVGSVGAYCGRSWLADGKWTAIANTMALLPNQGIPAEFLFLAMHGIEKWPRRGAAQPFISKADAGAKILPRPPQYVWTSFAGCVGPIFKLVSALNASNRNLAAARDLLLPRLVSGQLSVADAERDLEKAA